VRKKSIDFFGSTVSGSLDSSAFGGLARDRSPRPVTREGSEGVVSEPRPESDNAPSQQRVTGRVERLRERLENSNFVLLKIPVEIHNLGHGQRLICMDSDRLPQELGLNEEAIGNLVQGGLVRLQPQKPRPKKRIDYEALQQTYRRMLAEGGFASQTELARHLGVSRVWVSIVLRGNRRNEID
jgi:hypothetical protein